jgi:hypothetical protein
VADGDGADGLVVLRDPERRAEWPDGLGHDTEVQRAQALVHHGQQDQQRGHARVYMPERHWPPRFVPVSPAFVWLGVPVQVDPLR